MKATVSQGKKPEGLPLGSALTERGVYLCHYTQLAVLKGTNTRCKRRWAGGGVGVGTHPSPRNNSLMGGGDAATLACSRCSKAHAAAPGQAAASCSTSTRVSAAWMQVWMGTTTRSRPLWASSTRRAAGASVMTKFKSMSNQLRARLVWSDEHNRGSSSGTPHTHTHTELCVVPVYTHVTSHDN